MAQLRNREAGFQRVTTFKPPVEIKGFLKPFYFKHLHGLTLGLIQKKHHFCHNPTS
jgi:hypothetical protein